MATKRDEALRQLFIFVRDSNSGRVSRVVVPSDLQVGLKNNPVSLDLNGRLSINVGEYNITSQNKGIIDILCSDTFVALTEVNAPSSGEALIRLPPNPKKGELHFIKDVSGFGGSTILKVSASAGFLINGQSGISVPGGAFGQIGIVYNRNAWHTITPETIGSSGSSTGDGDSQAEYILFSATGSLPNAKVITAGSNISLVDGGGTLTINGLATNGADPGASYVVMSSTASLPNERALTAGTGLELTDGGANGDATFAINDNVVATVSGTTFTGPVSASAGLSGSLQLIASGLPYLVGQGLVSITTQSNGQVIISGSGDGGSGNGVGGDPNATYVLSESTGSLPNSYVLIAGPNIAINSGSGFISITGSAGGSGSGADPNAQYVVMAVTASLPNERALNAGTGINITDGGGGGNVTFAINDNVVATVSGTTFTGPVSASSGLSGSLQQVAPGLSYLVGAGLVTVTSQSNGQIIISGSGDGTGNGEIGADVSASYIVVGVTGSLPNERVVTAGTGINITDGGAGSPVTFDIDDNVVATVSGTTFTGPVSASAGLSGSLQQVAPGLSYLVGAGLVTIISQSNGQIIISGSGDGAGSGGSDGGDPNARYVITESTGSLPNAFVIQAGPGIEINSGSNIISISGSSTGSVQLACYHDLTHDPVALWQFSSSLRDDSGNNLDLQLAQGTERYVDLIPGLRGVYLDGNSYLNRSSNDIELSMTGAMSIEAIIALPNPPSGNVFLVTMGATGETEDDNYLYMLRMRQSEPMQFAYSHERNSGINVDFFGDPDILPPQHPRVPYHFAFTRDADSNVVSFYVNGELITSSSTLTTATRGSTPAQIFQVGNADGFGSSTTPLMISSLKVISGTALTQAEIKAEFDRTLGCLYLLGAQGPSGSPGADGADGSSGADPGASYVVMSSTASLDNERVLTAGIGLELTDGGANGNATFAIDDNVVATVSGTTFTGPVSASLGLSGSLQQVAPELSYLVGAGLVTITTQSNGQIIISGSGDVDSDWTVNGSSLYTTSSIVVGVEASAQDFGTDVIGFVSGAISGTEKFVFGGDVRVSGTLVIGTGSLHIEESNVRTSGELKFFDEDNPDGLSLSDLKNSVKSALYHDLTHSPVGLWQFSSSLRDDSGNNFNLSASFIDAWQTILGTPTGYWEADNWDGISSTWPATNGPDMNLVNGPTKGTDAVGRTVIEFDGTQYGEAHSLATAHEGQPERSFALLVAGNDFVTELGDYLLSFRDGSEGAVRKVIQYAGTGGDISTMWIRAADGADYSQTVTDINSIPSGTVTVAFCYDGVTNAVRWVYHGPTGTQAYELSSAFPLPFSGSFDFDQWRFLSAGSFGRLQADIHKVAYFDNVRPSLETLVDAAQSAYIEGAERYIEMAPGLRGVLFDGNVYYTRTATDIELAMTGAMTFEAILSIPPFYPGSETELSLLSMDASGETENANTLYYVRTLSLVPYIQWGYVSESGAGVDEVYTDSDAMIQVPRGLPFHFAFTRDADTNVVKYYANGNLIASSSALTGSTRGSSPSQTFKLGRSDSEDVTTAYMYMASAKLISGTALTQAQIKSEYEATLGQLYT